MREHLVAVGATLLGIAGACWIAGASVESSIRQADENIAIAERELKRENRAQLQAKLDATRQSERA